VISITRRCVTCRRGKDSESVKIASLRICCCILQHVVTDSSLEVELVGNSFLAAVFSGMHDISGDVKTESMCALSILAQMAPRIITSVNTPSVMGALAQNLPNKQSRLRLLTICAFLDSTCISSSLDSGLYLDSEVFLAVLDAATNDISISVWTRTGREHKHLLQVRKRLACMIGRLLVPLDTRGRRSADVPVHVRVLRALEAHVFIVVMHLISDDVSDVIDAALGDVEAATLRCFGCVSANSKAIHSRARRLTKQGDLCMNTICSGKVLLHTHALIASLCEEVLDSLIRQTRRFESGSCSVLKSTRYASQSKRWFRDLRVVLTHGEPTVRSCTFRWHILHVCFFESVNTKQVLI